MYACEPMHMHVHLCSHAGVSFAKMTQFQPQKHIRIGVCDVQVEGNCTFPPSSASLHSSYKQVTL